MKDKIRKTVFILLTISATIFTICMQSDIKPKPQIYFIGFSALTTILLFTKVKILSGSLYSVLTGIMFYILYFFICMIVIDFIAPNRATAILEDGRKVNFMDFIFIYAVIAGLILSVITVLVYTRSRKKMSLITYEKYFALTTFVSTSIGYYIFENL